MRACGIAIPPPVPVDPSSSRFKSALAISSAGNFNVSEARCASPYSNRTLPGAKKLASTSLCDSLFELPL